MSSRQRREISGAARAALNERKARSRGVALHELAAVVGSRGGAVTQRQLEVIASVLSYTTPASALARMLQAWLAGCQGVPDGVVARFFASNAWTDILDRAKAAELGERRGLPPVEDPSGPRQSVDPRKDFAVGGIRAAFAISEDEAETLGLKLLVGERRRSSLRRRAEGVPTSEEARTARQTAAEKAAELGVSRRTLFRHAARDRATAVEAAAAAVRQAAGTQSGSTNEDREPWVTAGVSRATWYRRKGGQASETANGTLGDHHKVKDQAGERGRPLAEFSAYQPYNLPTDRVAESASLGLTGAAASPASFHTAESRRLAVLAQRLGLTWQGG